MPRSNNTFIVGLHIFVWVLLAGLLFGVLSAAVEIGLLNSAVNPTILLIVVSGVAISGIFVEIYMMGYGAKRLNK